jgi:hypothetical protein
MKRFRTIIERLRAGTHHALGARMRNDFESRVLFGPTSVLAAIALVAGCSARAQTTSARPPDPPPGPSAQASASRTFAVTRLFLGDTQRDGTKSATAWKQLGYDLDGKASTRTSSDVCTPHDSKQLAQQSDGDEGIDNAWGAAVVPILQSITYPVSERATQAILGGGYTVLVAVAGLSDDPSQTNTGVAGRVLLGAPLAAAPSFATTDDWPVAPASLASGFLDGGAKTAFPTAYVTGGRWVGVPSADLVMHLAWVGDPAIAIIGPAFDMTIHHVVVTFDHLSPSRLSNGTIAGVISARELAAKVRPVLAEFGGTFCSTDTSAFEEDVLAAADMMLDGSNAPGAECDAISIGIGFEAAEIGNVTSVGQDPPLPPSTCDAGADGG